MYGYPVTPPKPHWKSKTYWANGLVLLLFAIESNLNLLQPLLAVNLYQLAVFAVTVMNMVLREFTDRGVGPLPPPPPPMTPDA